LEGRLGLSAPQIRRTIIANLDAVPMPDLAATGEEALTAARAHAPSVAISALTGEGIEALLAKIDEVLPFDLLSRVQFRFPIGEGAGLSMLHELGRVLDVRYGETFCDVDAEVPESLRQRLAAFVS
jgi:50S ribosomal subunit-associated GTPase HflX